MSHMAQTKRWLGLGASKFTEFTDELRALPRARRRTVRCALPGAQPKGLLGDLAVGQSVTVRWSEGRARLEVEEPFHCSTCGQVLSELRLVSMSPAVTTCPACGRPPTA